MTRFVKRDPNAGYTKVPSPSTCQIYMIILHYTRIPWVRFGSPEWLISPVPNLSRICPRQLILSRLSCSKPHLSCCKQDSWISRLPISKHLGDLEIKFAKRGAKSCFHKKSPYHRGVSLWDTLDNNIQLLTTIRRFKHAIDKLPLLLLISCYINFTVPIVRLSHMLFTYI